MIRNCAVRGIERTEGDWKVESAQEKFVAPYIVNCPGAWGDVIARMVGDEAPLVAEAPLVMVTAPVSRFALPVIGAIGRKLSLKQLPNGVVLIGGAASINGSRIGCSRRRHG